MLTEEKIKLAAQKWAIDEKKKWPHLSAPEFIAGAKWAKEILERRIDELADKTDTQRKVIEELRAENERLINFFIHLQEASAKYVWHPASTPPKHNGDVIAVLSDGTFFMARHNNISGWGFYFLDNGLQFDDTLGRNVTHWMPLSSLPSI